MEIEEVVVEIVMGLFLLFLSYQVGIKENITFLHSYHYTHLNPKDKKAFTCIFHLSSALFPGIQST